MTKGYKVDQRGQNIGFWQAGRDCVRGTFSYGGYTTRKGYFFGGILISLPGIILQIFSALLMMSSMSNMLSNPEASSASFETGMTVSMLSLICYILAAISGLPSAVRRLRDTGLNNQGIIIFLISILILSLLSTINIVAAIVAVYVFCQPSGKFLTTDQNHILFRNRDQEFQEILQPNGKVRTASDFQSLKSPLLRLVAISFLVIACLSVYLYNKNQNTQNVTITSNSSAIDISTYDMILYSDGESGYGTAEVEITAIPYYEGYDEELEQLLWNPTITLSKEEGLSNGDLVTVRIEVDQDQLESLGFESIGTYEQDVRIENLEEPYATSSSTQASSNLQEDILSNSIVTNVMATSYLSEPQHNLEHLPKNLIDGDRTTAWVEAASGQGIHESVTLTLDGVYRISQLSLFTGYQLSEDIFHKNSRPAKLQLTFSDNSSQEIDVNDQMREQLIELPQSVETSSVTVTIIKTFAGNKDEDTAISEIRFIGQKSQGSAPSSSPSSTAASLEEWPLSKQNELAQYMVEFGNEMNQPNYQRFAITKPVIWSGRQLDENFKILDGYEYWYDNGQQVHRYIFAINITREPIVLYSKDTGDPEFYLVGLTQNEMLPVAFREIYFR
ncbi:TPA: DUF805 domain-containing protein [Streptococcus suis]|nr:DUF805 domain-containing protein [Streptococcus suis]